MRRRYGQGNSAPLADHFVQSLRIPFSDYISPYLTNQLLMKRSFFLCAALAAATLSFSSCDYSKGPGTETQREGTFAEAPDARATDTDLDSVNAGLDAPIPQGLDSPADQAQKDSPPTSKNGAENAPGGQNPPEQNGSN